MTSVQLTVGTACEKYGQLANVAKRCQESGGSFDILSRKDGRMRRLVQVQVPPRDSLNSLCHSIYHCITASLHHCTTCRCSGCLGGVSKQGSEEVTCLYWHRPYWHYNVPSIGKRRKGAIRVNSSACLRRGCKPLLDIVCAEDCSMWQRDVSFFDAICFRFAFLIAVSLRGQKPYIQLVESLQYYSLESGNLSMQDSCWEQVEENSGNAKIYFAARPCSAFDG